MTRDQEVVPCWKSVKKAAGEIAAMIKEADLSSATWEAVQEQVLPLLCPVLPRTWGFMPMIFFIEIGMAAGLYGLTEIVWAKRNQRMAEKINMRARELLSGTIAEGVEAKPAQELEPIMPVIEKWTSAAKVGLLAAAGAYGLAGLLALAGRTLARFRPEVWK